MSFMGEHANVTVAAISGGAPWRLSRNPHECSLYLDIRTVPGQTVDGVKRELRRVLSGFADRKGIPEPKLHLYVTDPPVLLDEKLPIIEALGAAQTVGHRRASGFDHPPAGRGCRASDRLWRAVRRLRAGRPHASGRAQGVVDARLRGARPGGGLRRRRRKSISRWRSISATGRRRDISPAVREGAGLAERARLRTYSRK